MTNMQLCDRCEEIRTECKSCELWKEECWMKHKNIPHHCWLCGEEIDD